MGKRKFIILNKKRESYAFSIAMSTSTITYAIQTDEKLAEFYTRDTFKDEWEVIYLDSEKGREWVKKILGVLYREAIKLEGELKTKRSVIDTLEEQIYEN